jgi:hypothetical protein
VGPFFHHNIMKASVVLPEFSTELIFISWCKDGQGSEADWLYMEILKEHKSTDEFKVPCKTDYKKVKYYKLYW